jgi:hypothetical protein
MDNLWHQICSWRFTRVLLCALGLGFALVILSAYTASRDNSTKEGLPMATAAVRDVPLIDQVVVEQTELALFALG